MSSAPVIYDIYRGVLLAEILLIGVLYTWALGKYLHRARRVEDRVLRRFRIGQAARVGGVLIILMVLGLAVIAAFGRGDLGRTIFNLMIQVSLWLFAIAWGLVDLPRFRSVVGRPDAAIQHLDDLDRKAFQRRAPRRDAG